MASYLHLTKSPNRHFIFWIMLFSGGHNSTNNLNGLFKLSQLETIIYKTVWNTMPRTSMPIFLKGGPSCWCSFGNQPFRRRASVRQSRPGPWTPGPLSGCTGRNGKWSRPLAAVVPPAWSPRGMECNVAVAFRLSNSGIEKYKVVFFKIFGFVFWFFIFLLQNT